MIYRKIYRSIWRLSCVPEARLGHRINLFGHFTGSRAQHSKPNPFQNQSQDPVPPPGWIPPRRPPMRANFPKFRVALSAVITGHVVYFLVWTLFPVPSVRSLMPRQLFDDSKSGSKPIKATSPSLAQRDDLTKRESGISDKAPMRLRMEQFIKENQKEIVHTIEQLDGKSFVIDEWDRPNGGGGISCVLQDGNVFEKAGVNVSVVYGTLPRAAIQRMRADHKSLDIDLEKLDYFAAGISIVMHAKNPMAPTVHLNYRYFETANPDGTSNAWWFGGGSDLTPSYLFDEDAIQFHRGLKEACDKHDKEYYPRFKKWCDDYFNNIHRSERRGVGGIFFDDLDHTTKDKEQLFAFVQDCLASFLPAYTTIINRRKSMPFTEKEKLWQQIRRGRYVEFNLVHDRGTSFGLNGANPRVESILMSLPLEARWEYMHQPDKSSREERLINILKNPVEWI